MATYMICLLVWLGAAFCVGVSAQFKMPLEMVALNALTREWHMSDVWHSLIVLICTFSAAQCLLRLS